MEVQGPSEPGVRRSLTRHSLRRPLEWRWRRTIVGRLAFCLVCIASGMMLLLLNNSSTAAQTGWQWYKTDPHVHSSVSSDGQVDLGLNSQAAGLGYNALFLSDHHEGSGYLMNNVFGANHVFYEDQLINWSPGTYGTLTTSLATVVGTPHNTGNNSLHLVAGSNTYGESYVSTIRGPNFRGGNIILRVAVRPVRIDPGSGVDVSVSIGGDPTVLKSPLGYTTQAGVISPGKSTVLIWQLGNTRTASSSPNTRVLTYPLTYTLNTWNIYTINVTNALADIPAADRPVDTAGLVNLKMTAAGNGGRADVYFDTYTLDAQSPESPAAEYINRTGFISTYDSSTFKIFPSYEMGQNHHMNRFNFGILSASDYVSYTNGADGILPTQQSGYPAQSDHPGFTTTDTETVTTQAFGADLLEVRETNMIADWDAILQQNVQVIGTWSTDAHTGIPMQTTATYIYAPSLTFDNLMRSLYEGRVFLGLNNFATRPAFNINPSSQEPYPARYPVYVAGNQNSAIVHFQASSLYTNDQIRWIVNGNLDSSSVTGNAAVNITKTVSLTNTTNYVRAEVRFTSGSIKAMTEPIFFIKVPGLPEGTSFYIDGVVTADNRNYTKISTKGITASAWLTTNQALSLTLTDPVGALVSTRVLTSTAPYAVTVDGVNAPQAASLTDFQAYTNSIWYRDAAAGQLYVKALHTAGTANVLVAFAAPPTPTVTAIPTGTDTPTSTQTPTYTPTNVQTDTATAVPTDTPTATGTPTYTLTPTNTAVVPTDTPTSTPVPTDTPTITATSTGTATDTPTPVPTDTPTITITNTPANTVTPTSTYTPTNSPVPSDTPTATGTPTNTAVVPTDTPTSTPVPTDTPTITATSTGTATDTPAPTFTSTSLPTATATPMNTLTPTVTPTFTGTNTPTVTSTITPTPTITRTPTATPLIQMLFSDGFESGDFSTWTGGSASGPTGSRLEVIGAAAFSGSWGAHMSNGVGGRAGLGPYEFANFAVPASHRVSGQTRIFINSATGTGSFRVLHLRDQARQKTVLRAGYSNGTWQLIQLQRDGTTATVNFATNLSVGMWQLLEITYDWSGTQPVGRAYLNGVLQAIITDNTAGSAYNVNSIYCLAYEDVITATGDLYFDDVKAANGYIGP